MERLETELCIYLKIYRVILNHLEAISTTVNILIISLPVLNSKEDLSSVTNRKRRSLSFETLESPVICEDLYRD